MKRLTLVDPSPPFPLLLPLLLLLLLAAATYAQSDTNSRVVELRCGAEAARNASVFLPSLIANMDGTREQVRSTGFGISTNGSDHSLAQCYRGLSRLDCMLCYSTARTTLPQCFPYIGGRVYLDGCFMRAEKYDFYGEFVGPGDAAQCGNATREGPGFEGAARRAVAGAIAAAPVGGGNATVSETAGSGAAVYVLADCWKTLNASVCGACLAMAAAAATGCLPSSEGMALNTGCFLRYSDANFFGTQDGGGDSTGAFAQRGESGQILETERGVRPLIELRIVAPASLIGGVGPREREGGGGCRGLQPTPFFLWGLLLTVAKEEDAGAWRF